VASLKTAFLSNGGGRGGTNRQTSGLSGSCVSRNCSRLRLLRGGADVDEQAKKEIRDLLIAFDRTLLVADPRQCEPKK